MTKADLEVLIQNLSEFSEVANSFIKSVGVHERGPSPEGIMVIAPFTYWDPLTETQEQEQVLVVTKWRQLQKSINACVTLLPKNQGDDLSEKTKKLQSFVELDSGWGISMDTAANGKQVVDLCSAIFDQLKRLLPALS
jgi:hypothetical protein